MHIRDMISRPFGIADATWRQRMMGLFLAVLTVCAYWGVLQAGFVWDDNSLTVGNPWVVSPDGWWHFWDLRQRDTPDFFPLVSSLFWLEYRVWGEFSSGWHAVNLLLHLVNVLLFWRLLVRLSLPGAWLAAAIFSVHPVNVASVAWVSEGKNTLSFLFFLLALGAWLEFDNVCSAASRRRYLWLSWLCFFLALLAKATAVVLPPLLLLLSWWRGRRLTRLQIWGSVPFFLLGLFLGTVTVEYQHAAHGGVRQLMVDGGLQGYLMTGFAIGGHALAAYVAHFLFPADLCAIYPMWTLPLHRWTTYLPAAGAVVLLVLLFCLRGRRWCRNAFFGMAALVTVLAPVLGFIPASFFQFSFCADHWAYMASAVFAIPVAWTVYRFSRIPGAWGRRLVAFAGVLILVGLAVVTWNRGVVYWSDEAFWSDTIARNPHAAIAWNNLGNCRKKAGRLREALSMYETAVRLEPGNFLYWRNLGVSKDLAGEPLGAVAALRQSQELNDDGESRLWLAHALFHSGMRREAVAEYRRVLEVEPDRVEACLMLARILTDSTEVELHNPREAAVLAAHAARSAYPFSTKLYVSALDAQAAALMAAGEPLRAAEPLRLLLRYFPEGGNPQAAVTRLEIQKRLDACLTPASAVP